MHKGLQINKITGEKIDKGGTLKNWPEDKKVDDNAQGLTSERCLRQTLCIEKRRRKLASIEDSMDASIWRVEDYIKKSKRKNNSSHQ